MPSDALAFARRSRDARIIDLLLLFRKKEDNCAMVSIARARDPLLTRINSNAELGNIDPLDDRTACYRCSQRNHRDYRICQPVSALPFRMTSIKDAASARHLICAIMMRTEIFSIARNV